MALAEKSCHLASFPPFSSSAADDDDGRQNRRCCWCCLLIWGNRSGQSGQGAARGPLHGPSGPEAPGTTGDTWEDTPDPRGGKWWNKVRRCKWGSGCGTCGSSCFLSPLFSVGKEKRRRRRTTTTTTTRRGGCTKKGRGLLGGEEEEEEEGLGLRSFFAPYFLSKSD